jgi:uncharacterized protein (TIGR03435 family)
MRFAAAALVLTLAAPTVAQSITPACALPTATAFDVATVKPSQRPSGSSSLGGTADTLTAAGSAFRLILYAYKLHDFQVSGGPNWLSTDTWDITAKVDQPPAGYNSLPNDARDAVARQRLQAVLAQRFNLKCHFETKELPVYNLILAKGGSRLTPTPADAKNIGSLSSNGRNRARRIDGTGVSLPFITAILSQNIGRTVVDKTGLTGLYTFTLTYVSDPDAASTDDAASAPTIFTALEEQLGLHLESAKGPVPILVIDDIQKPSEN